MCLIHRDLRSVFVKCLNTNYFIHLYFNRQNPNCIHYLISVEWILPSSLLSAALLKRPSDSTLTTDLKELYVTPRTRNQLVWSKFSSMTEYSLIVKVSGSKKIEPSHEVYHKIIQATDWSRAKSVFGAGVIPTPLFSTKLFGASNLDNLVWGHTSVHYF